MIAIPKQVEYALMVLGVMHQGSPGTLFAARTLCDDLGIPFDVTSKAMQRMNHAKILRSVQGKYGGYQIIRGLADVSLEELVDVVSGHPTVAACLQHGNTGCRLEATCTIRKAVRRLDARIHSVMADTSVLDLIG